MILFISHDIFVGRTVSLLKTNFFQQFPISSGNTATSMKTSSEITWRNCIIFWMAKIWPFQFGMLITMSIIWFYPSKKCWTNLHTNVRFRFHRFCSIVKIEKWPPHFWLRVCTVFPFEWRSKVWGSLLDFNNAVKAESRC